MSLEKVRALRDRWRGVAPLQEGLNEAFDEIGFTESYVDQRIQGMGALSRQPKYIKDNIWGMIKADAELVRLLDSPILQRLRAIKQLGVSYLTYPSAEHSRFIHSLGMSAVVSKFVEAIDTRAAEDTGVHSGQRYLRVDQLGDVAPCEFVHAALLHDVGHMPFSHASERALDANLESFTCGGRQLGQFRTDTATKLLKPKNVSLSEALSLLVVLSLRFEKFYRQFVRSGNADGDCLLRIACLIGGMPPSAALTGVSEVISSAAVDADKIDYIARDAAACGIPAGVDVSRIFLRSGLLEIDGETARKHGLRENPLEREVLFVVNASGADTLDEISQSRAALYQRVYLHPVTRAAEAVLAQALDLNCASPRANPKLTDALKLWALSDDALLRELLSSEVVGVRNLGERLKARVLPKKACVFSAALAETHMPLREIFATGTQLTGIKELEKQIKNPKLDELSLQDMKFDKAKQIELAIREEVKRLASVLRRVGRQDLVPPKPPETLVLVPRAHMDKVRQDAIVLQNGDLLRTTDFTNVHGQQDALDIFKSVGFIMTEPEWRSIVMIATRTVLFKRKAELTRTNLFGVDGPQYVSRLILSIGGVIRKAGIDRANSSEVLSALVDGGYFDTQPLLAPQEDYVSAPYAAVHARMAKFDGEKSWSVSRRSIAAFVNQFPPRLRPSLLDMLTHIRYFGNEELSASVETLLGGRTPGLVVPLSVSSGPRVLNSIKSLSSLSAFGFKNALPEALYEEDDSAPIYLVDDNISSATQARAQFLAWIGVPEDQWPEECVGEPGIARVPIPPMYIEKLKSRELFFVASAGRAKGRDALRDVVLSNGFRFGDVLFRHDLTGVEWPEELATYLKLVGRSLIASTKFGKLYGDLNRSQKHYCRHRAFGYDGVGALVCTSDNVPTATITALWSPGVYENEPWMPLAIRRGQLKNLILG